MPASSKLQNSILNGLGIVYTLFAIFAFVNVYTFVHLSGSAPLSYSLYGVLYAAIAFLFFTKERWLLQFFAANLLANLTLFAMRTYAAHGTSLLPVVIVGLNAALVWYLYYNYRSLRDSMVGRIAAGLTFLLWVITIYAVINNL